MTSGWEHLASFPQRPGKTSFSTGAMRGKELESTLPCAKGGVKDYISILSKHVRLEGTTEVVCSKPRHLIDWDAGAQEVKLHA